ncbi:hypothetical protein MTsDn5_03000 [Alteromonas gracilis]|uniref:hypothetical protein n=1 Tax=Alteromonas gracilis TaxID=1479524 RepID=UPI0036F1CDA5
MANVSEFYRTFTEEQLQKDELKIVTLNSRYKVEWNNSSQFFIVCEDEDFRKEFTRHLEKVIGILPLKANRNRTRFISIGEENSIQVSENRGGEVSLLDGFSERIIGIKELDDGQLLVATSDGVLSFCDPETGQILSVIKANFDDLDDVLVLFQEKVVIVRSGDDTSIWRFNGSLVVTLNGIKSNIHKASYLKSKNWLVWKSKVDVSLWSNEGNLLKDFAFRIEGENDYTELDDGNLLFRQSKSVIGLYNSNGEQIHVHSNDPETTKGFTRLTASHQSTSKNIEKKPNIDFFPHSRNFFANPRNNFFVPVNEFERQNLSFSNNSEQRKVWDFFFRPDVQELRTVLKDTVKSSRITEKKITEQINGTQTSLENESRKKDFNRFVSWIFVLLFCISGGVGFYAFKNIDFLKRVYGNMGIPIKEVADKPEIFALLPTLPIALLLFIFAIRFSRAKAKVLQFTSDIEVQKAILQGHSGVIASIKKYRRRLISQIPTLQAGQQDLYSGNFIKDYIWGRLNGDLKSKAMRECNIEIEDIVYKTGEPIILTSWSLIQGDTKRKAASDRIPFNNEQAVRIIAGGSLVFAVQLVQYIFLTKDKIDIFSMYYDFITDKAHCQRTGTYFYKDVTTTSTEIVNRDNIFESGGVSNDVTATEFYFTLTSGDRVSLTLLNEDSLSKINEESKNNESISPSLQLKQLDRAEQDLNESNLSDEEREEELQLINMDRQSALLALQQTESKEHVNKANEAIVAIQTLIAPFKRELS